MTQTAVKHFTVDEANATLPYVRRIVQDIVAEYEQWRDAIYRYEVVAAGNTAETGETAEQVVLREEVDAIAQRINEYINELAGVGCVFKGFEGGLVDFHSQLAGRDVYLCWKLGEPRVEHWHELEAGFSARQPIPAELMSGDNE
jgi:hypothetical protein